MFMLGDIPIVASVYDILLTLRAELQSNNILLLNNITEPKYEGQDIKVTCPFHKGGQESKPSCGVTTKEFKRGGRTIRAGTANCFSCKTHMELPNLVSYCFGKDDDGIFGEQWLLEHFCDYEYEDRGKFFNRMGIRQEKPTEEVEYITEEELSSYRYYHPYMYKRHLTDDLIEKFDIGFQKNFQMKEGLKPFDCITFPVKDMSGKVVFIARRAINSKIFHYDAGVNKSLTYLYEAKQMFPNSTELWICESMLNALMLFKWGKPAIALLGTGSKQQYDELKHLDYRKYVLCLDNDNAGQRGSEKLAKILGNYKLIENLTTPNGYDVNDLGELGSFEEFRKMLLTR